MTHYENIKQLLTEIKNCAPADISKYFNPVSHIFALLTKAEQNECAKEFYNWAEENSLKQPVKLCYAEFLLGVHFFLSDDLETGLRWLREARNSFELHNDKEGIGMCTTVMGGTYRTQGNNDLALKTWWEAYGLLNQSGTYTFFLSAASNGMANVYLEMQNLDEAYKMFQISLERSEKTDDFYFINYSLHGFSKVYMQQKKQAEAKECLEKALAFAEKSKNHPAIATSMTELANYLFQTGGVKEAEQLHKRALRVREEHNALGGATTNCIKLGEIYNKQSRYEDALHILLHGLAIAEKIKAKPKIYQMHLLLSEIYQNRNEAEKSLNHYKIYHRVLEEVEKEDNEKKLKNIKIMFEAEQTLKENAIIKKQKAEIEKKNIELQETIDELTLTRISRKAKVVTLVISIVLFIFSDSILGFALNILSTDNYFASLAVKMGIIFSLSPINAAIEKFLLRKVIKKKKQLKEDLSGENETSSGSMIV